MCFPKWKLGSLNNSRDELGEERIKKPEDWYSCKSKEKKVKKGGSLRNAECIMYTNVCDGTTEKRKPKMFQEIGSEHFPQLLKNNLRIQER